MNSSRGIALFSGVPVIEVTQARLGSLRDEVARFSRNHLMNVNEQELVAVLTDKYSMDVPRLRCDLMHTLAPRDTEVEVDGFAYGSPGPVILHGTLIRIEIPFEGEPGLLEVQPEECTTFPPYGIVEEPNLYLRFPRLDHDTTDLKSQIEREIALIEQHLSSLTRTAERFRADVERLAQALVSSRRKRIIEDERLVESLNIPLKRRADAPTTYTVPVHRRELSLPTASAETPKLDPTLSESEYDQILSILRCMVRVMEQSPHAFAHMDEEAIRTHFLVQLNAQYQGQATGETFNFKGKTDIQIRWEGEIVFIAECKFWRGQKSFGEAIDQLLSYLTWRDTKAALLVFNRQTDFSGVLARIKEAVSRHPCFSRVQKDAAITETQYVFVQPRDHQREVLLTVMAFDVPANDA